MLSIPQSKDDVLFQSEGLVNLWMLFLFVYLIHIHITAYRDASCQNQKVTLSKHQITLGRKMSDKQGEIKCKTGHKVEIKHYTCISLAIESMLFVNSFTDMNQSSQHWKCNLW